ncbi:NADPH-dependent F420 reductase [Nocardioides mangrovi]|uniref:NAD(P)-binding domain-containing protein n=1 Tax=Nocardioides mangrovi TaxID=2874580 RepID=A0ABS7UJU3_9ACTN|nr:NAD(P)-binding domain-containing protein [Nocardioides mangrovi]MBZ5741157.1 NAD(P)-binding domain-containing protein [Nocardioides mangrovi]
MGGSAALPFAPKRSLVRTQYRPPSARERTVRNAARLRAVSRSMTTIGLIGAGNIGSAIARRAVAAGYDVVLSNSRGPETLGDLVSELGPHASAATAAEAAAAGDLVVVTIPLKSIGAVPVEPLRGKTVIDTNNYYPQRDGQIAELDDETSTTSELLQAHLPESHVVKAFNNIFHVFIGTLARPAGDPERSVLAIAGDDADAKAEAAAFIGDVGFDAHDIGPLAEGWRYQRDLPAYAGLYFDDDGNARPVDAALLDDKLAQAQRYRDM